VNLRHAVALALVGWYLLLPPHSGRKPEELKFDLTAPLSRWTHSQKVFDSALDCELATARVRSPLDRLLPNDEARSKWHHALDAARCVPEDDPRLKGK
jgi:hypothetical protein